MINLKVDSANMKITVNATFEELAEIVKYEYVCLNGNRSGNITVLDIDLGCDLHDYNIITFEFNTSPEFAEIIPFLETFLETDESRKAFSDLVYVSHGYGKSSQVISRI